MRILFISRWFPCPPDNGSKLRVYSLLRGLAQHYEITLLSFADQPDSDPNTSELKSLCEEVRILPWKPFEPRSLRARLGFFNPSPRSVIDTFSADMGRCIRKAITEKDYDLAIASQLGAAVYRRFMRGLPALFEEVEVSLLYESVLNATSAWQRLRSGMTWTKHRRYLTHLLKDFDACTVVSEQERRLLTRIVDGNSNIEVIPNCVSLADYQGIEGVPRPLTLIFTGALRYPPNYEAMVWFMGRVYPRLQAIYPDIQLTITGDHAGRRLPSTENVILTGVLDDVKSHIARSLVNLAPIFSGGGTRLKILEAMALRTPVVSTSKGAEGLDVRHGEHLLIANTPGEFAEAVIRIFEDPQLRCHLVDNAFQTVCEKYNWSNMMPRFIDLVEKISRV